MRQMRQSMILGGAVLVAAVAGPAWAGPGCAFTAPRDLDVPAAGIATLEVRAQAGELEIRGEPGLARVGVHGTACASRASDLEQIRLVQERRGDRLVLIAEMPESSGWGNEQRSLDLVLRVPSRLALEVDDGSGDATVRGVASLDIDDGSGGLRIADVAGTVRVRDGSGDVDVQDVGALHVTGDGSGDIRASGVRGDVRVDEDGSGELRFSRVGGDVRVDHDGSGGIVAEDVGGDFVVEDAGSGGVEHRAVRGRVSIPEH